MIRVLFMGLSRVQQARESSKMGQSHGLEIQLLSTEVVRPGGQGTQHTKHLLQLGLKVLMQNIIWGSFLIKMCKECRIWKVINLVSFITFVLLSLTLPS